MHLFYNALFHELLLIIIVGNAQAVNVFLDTSNVYYDKSFDVNITVDPQGSAIAGVQTDVIFDNTTLELISIKKGNLLNQSTNAFFTVVSQNNTHISNIIGVVLGNTSITGSDVFAILTFKAKNTGEAFVELKNLKISDPNAIKHKPLKCKVCYHETQW